MYFLILLDIIQILNPNDIIRYTIHKLILII